MVTCIKAGCADLQHFEERRKARDFHSQLEIGSFDIELSSRIYVRELEERE